MNLFDFSSFQPRRGITVDRLERIKREGSPPYVWTMGVTAPGATSVINVQSQFPASRKYEPLDYIEIVNNEPDINLTVVINGNDSRLCPHGTIRTIHGQGVALWHIAITNGHATDSTTSGRVICTLQREPMTIDKWAVKQ